MNTKATLEGSNGLNGCRENRLLEPEFELSRRSVRLIVLRETQGSNEAWSVVVQRTNAPWGLFATELVDVAFAPAELSDLAFLVDIAKSCLGRVVGRSESP